jgi:hypothetical protein
MSLPIEQQHSGEHGLPRAFGFVGLGTPDIHFALNDRFIATVPQEGNSAVLRLGAHITLSRLSSTKGYEAGSENLEEDVRNKENQFSDLIKAAQTNFMSRSFIDSDLGAAKGLASEAIFFHIARTAGLSVLPTSLYTDIRGSDFAISIPGKSDLMIDITSTKSHFYMADKLQKDNLILFLPIDINAYNKRSEETGITQVTHQVLADLIQDKSTTREEIQYGRLPNTHTRDEQETARQQLEAIIDFNRHVTFDFANMGLIRNEKAANRLAGLYQLKKLCASAY